LGLLLFVSLPLPLLGFTAWVIHTYIWKQRVVKYILFGEPKGVEGVVGLVKRSLFSLNNGFWKDNSRVHFLDRFGLLFKNTRGPIFTFTNNQEVRYDYQFKCYRWNTIERLGESVWLSYVRTHYMSFYIGRNILLCILLNLVPNGVAGLVLLSILLGVHSLYMSYIVPLSSHQTQFVKLLTVHSELLVYVFALLYATTEKEIFEQMVFGAQMAGVFVSIAGSMTSSLGMVGVMIRNWFRKDSFYKERILGRIYFYKWRDLCIQRHHRAK